MNFFDYNGLCAQSLEVLCDDTNAFSGHAPWAYEEAEMYSFGNSFRSYGFYPKSLPLYCSSCHGVKYAFDFAEYELKTKAEFFLVFSTAHQRAYKLLSTVECHCIMAPFVWYRRKNFIAQYPDARGTLVFPGHQTKEIDLLCGIEEYIEFLKDFPEERRPVCVCLHPVDVQKGVHKIYQQHGIPVYSAGSYFDQRFTERFYEILRNFKQVSTNILGSHVFYAVEMGIPVSLVGPTFTYYNKSDPNVPQGEMFNIYTDTPSYKKIERVFLGFNNHVTAEQKEIVEEHLGVHTTISRLRMAVLLYRAFLVVTIRKMCCRVMTLAKVAVKKIFLQYPRLARKAVAVFNRLTPLAQKCIVKLQQEEWGVQCRPNTTDYRVFEQVFYDFPKCFTKDAAKVIVDAGANAGFSAVWFARKYKDATIYAIEPSKQNYTALVENCKNYANIIPIHGAITNQDGEMFCVDVEDGEWAYVVSTTCADASKAEKCTVFSMHTFLEKYDINSIDIFKVDIEGSECALFDNSSSTWISLCEQINIEPHDWLTPQSSRSIFRAFENLPEYACHVAGEHFIFEKKHAKLSCNNCLTSEN